MKRLTVFALALALAPLAFAEDTPKPLRRSVPKDKEKDAAETDAPERPSLEAVANPTPLAPASTPKPMRGDGNDGSPSDPGEGA